MTTFLMILIFFALAAVVALLLWIERWPWHIVRGSTIRALKWLGFRRSITGGAHGVFYGRWGPNYILTMRKLARLFGRRGRDWMEQGYHGKVLTHDLAAAVITIDREVPLQDLGDQVIPYRRARDIVLNADTGYALTECMCKRDRKSHRGGECAASKEPYQTCMLVGAPELCDFLIDHNPKTSRRISRDEALAKLDEFHALGLVHNAWFKSCLNDRFYAICNCCSCCCLGFETMKLGIRQISPSGFVAVTDRLKCTGCGTCAAACPFAAIEIAGSAGDAHAVLNWDRCFGCGVCIEKCPSAARQLVRDEKKGRPMDVRMLAKGDDGHPSKNG